MNTQSTYTLFGTKTKLIDVIMSLTWGQSAWIFCRKFQLLAMALFKINNKILSRVTFCPGDGQVVDLKNPSETKRSAFCSPLPFPSTRDRGTSGKIKNSTNFYEWLVGITDGDGTFYFNRNKKGVWGFTFKIGQSTYNLRVLYYIKSMLGVGSVSVPNSNDNVAEFRVRDIQLIIQHVLPIFDNYPLLTSKHFNYSIFREAILIMGNPSLSKEVKDDLINKLKSKSLGTDYVSPAWHIIDNSVNSNKDALKVVSKNWLIGFTEAEGSFYIVKKGVQRLVHAFEITQKKDIIVLEAIAKILQGDKGKVTKKNTYNTIIFTGSKDIQFIVKYFHKTMKGMKALEYRIWARSFATPNKDFEYLMKIRNTMRNIRSIRLNKNFSIKKNI